MSTCTGTLPDLQTVDFRLPIGTGILVVSSPFQNFVCRVRCYSKSLNICVRALSTANGTGGRRSRVILNEVELNNIIQISRILFV
jgi:hypothetical protein